MSHMDIFMTCNFGVAVFIPTTDAVTSVTTVAEMRKQERERKRDRRELLEAELSASFKQKVGEDDK